MNKKNTLLIGIVLLAALVPAVFSLFHPGFFVTDDGEWMIIRLSAFYQALADGQFPVRFLHRLNFDYGYPVSTFLYPGFLYIGVVLHLLKIGFVESVKIILGLSLVGSAVFTYLWLHSVFHKKLASIIGALVALYIPYHLYDVYARGSVGEVLALFWVPFIFWMIERRSMFLTSIGIFFLIISHNTLAFLFLPMIVWYMIIKATRAKQKKSLIVQYLIILITACGMAAFFWLPILAELPLTQFTKTTVSNPLNYFADLGLIGYVTIGSILCTFIVVAKNHLWGKKDLMTAELFLFLGNALSNLLLSHAISTPLWRLAPDIFIQFPFRLLSIEVISVPFIIAFVITRLSLRYRTLFSIVVIVLLGLSAYPYLAPKEFVDRGEGFYTTNDATTTVKDEYMPIWVKENPLQRPVEKVHITQGQGTIEEVLSDNHIIHFFSNNVTDTKVQVNTLYWPGWEARSNGVMLPISYNNPYGAMELSLPAGKQQVMLTFNETMLRLISDIVSFVSFAILILVSLLRKRVFSVSV